MQDDFNPASDERVSRILIRDDDQACADKPIRDEDDFLRRKMYGKRQLPENGLSLFRRRKPDQFIYDRLCARKKKGKTVFVDMHLGLATCKFRSLQAAKFQHHSTEDNPEHISLRCPDCDLADVSDDEKICSPSDKGECPFFQLNDPLGLVDIFTDDVAPSLRNRS